MTLPDSRTFVLGLSGGSGAQYGLRLLEVLLQSGHRAQLVASGAGLRVLKHVRVESPGEEATATAVLIGAFPGNHERPIGLTTGGRVALVSRRVQVDPKLAIEVGSRLPPCPVATMTRGQRRFQRAARTIRIGG